MDKDFEEPLTLDTERVPGRCYLPHGLSLEQEHEINICLVDAKKAWKSYRKLKDLFLQQTNEIKEIKRTFSQMVSGKKKVTTQYFESPNEKLLRKYIDELKRDNEVIKNRYKAKLQENREKILALKEQLDLYISFTEEGNKENAELMLKVDETLKYAREQDRYYKGLIEKHMEESDAQLKSAYEDINNLKAHLERSKIDFDSLNNNPSEIFLQLYTEYLEGDLSLPEDPEILKEIIYEAMGQLVNISSELGMTKQDLKSIEDVYQIASNELTSSIEKNNDLTTSLEAANDLIEKLKTSSLTNSAQNDIHNYKKTESKQNIRSTEPRMRKRLSSDSRSDILSNNQFFSNEKIINHGRTLSPESTGYDSLKTNDKDEAMLSIKNDINLTHSYDSNYSFNLDDLIEKNNNLENALRDLYYNYKKLKHENDTLYDRIRIQEKPIIQPNNNDENNLNKLNESKNKTTQNELEVLQKNFNNLTMESSKLKTENKELTNLLEEAFIEASKVANLNKENARLKQTIIELNTKLDALKVDP